MLGTTGLTSMVHLIVYFLELCHNSSTGSQHDIVSRHATLKVNTMKPPSKGETPTGLGLCEWGLICHLFDRAMFKKLDERQNFGTKRDLLMTSPWVVF